MVMVVPPYKIGGHTYFGEFCHVSQHTKIGKFCSIGNLCTIGARQHDMSALSTWPHEATLDAVEKLNKPTTVGNDVWIGCNSVILSGVTVGDGAVIGAGAVVTKDVPPYAIAYGNPARVRKYRFDDATIAELLRLAWWDKPVEIIKALPMMDVRACIEFLQEGKTNGRNHAETYPAEVRCAPFISSRAG